VLHDAEHDGFEARATRCLFRGSDELCTDALAPQRIDHT
jgi:hypothetical protein